MNNTLPLMDINNSTSMIYKVYSIEHDPKVVKFEIAFINDHSNLLFKHILYEEDLIILSHLQLLNTGKYHFVEPSLYIDIKNIHEKTIDITIHLKALLENHDSAHRADNAYDMTVEKHGFIQFIEYLQHHLVQ
ncbi:hypothetical protein BFS35_007610 [Macrococcoides goetzii]|uniref:Uncharacterized protein n=2 Tax=Macrococcoides goetzii TaxID=1891097 RepID=A0A395GC90_9STAP|nr:hypothetical protein BFS35_007610 [Macrococcus goetzii]